ncbi:hypothetical protein, partial [Salmonella sp. NW1027]|uniref:hypothetical protein n=1 Tax=Salmonella sp. NW1027 TaxID=2947465 RepID=UPI003F465D64
SLKTSIKTITYLSDIGCLEIQGASLLRLANTPRGSTAFEKALAEVERAVNSVAQGAKSDALSE